MLANALVTTLALAAPQEPWTRDQMAEDLAQLAASVRERWSYLEDRSANAGLDLDAVLQESLDALDQVRSRADFARVLRVFVAHLQDGHGHVSIDADEPPRRLLCLELKPCAEGAAVAATDGEGVTVSADARTPRRGDLLLSIDGHSVEQLLVELEQVTTSSTPGQRRRRAIQALVHTTAEAADVELLDGEGQRYRTRVRTRAWPPVGARRGNWNLSWPEPGVAMLRIESFAVEDWEAWLAAEHDEREPLLRATYERIEEVFDELHEARAEALILDLRGNGGGTDSLGIHLSKHLLHEPFRYFRLSARGASGWREPGGLVYATETGMQPFHGRLVALTDEHCFSTTDNFLRCMRDLHPRFVAVGRPTGGGTGAPRPIATLKHSGATVTLCTMRVYGPKSGLTEGRGTKPDIEVTWTRSDIAEGRDPDLAAALRALEK